MNFRFMILQIIQSIKALAAIYAANITQRSFFSSCFLERCDIKFDCDVVAKSQMLHLKGLSLS